MPGKKKTNNQSPNPNPCTQCTLTLVPF